MEADGRGGREVRRTRRRGRLARQAENQEDRPHQDQRKWAALDETSKPSTTHSLRVSIGLASNKQGTPPLGRMSRQPSTAFTGQRRTKKVRQEGHRGVAEEQKLGGIGTLKGNRAALGLTIDRWKRRVKIEGERD
ncbi:hypothetical protein GWK47_023272 [Chionoecetes opilio]|uniref:Uncharacterized protein n=1 Tax=Chionoecetes opilio TaxID=41210 RepID=A0A8J4XMR4_CHIOP|nr:hypothetical protein GWK47_023272 [Chionoecetes opilio]